MTVEPLPPGYAPLVLAGLDAKPRMRARCHDCAFAPEGSPEQDGPQWFAILSGVDKGKPFYCHQGMPMEGDRYVPPVGLDGAPVGDERICAGWVEMRARFLAVRRQDLLDDLWALPHDNPDLVRAVELLTRVSFAYAGSARG